MRAACIMLMTAWAACAAEAQVCSSVTGRTVSATGTATLRLRPDRVSFSVGVETEAVSVTEALKGNSTKVEAVIAKLKHKGVEARQIQTSQFEIGPRTEEGKKPIGFRVSNTVTITREDPTLVGDLLQAAVEAGANQAGSLHFFVADPSKARDRGLELAFDDAKAKASRLAALSHRELGDVACVAEGGYSMSGYLQNTANETIAVSADAPSVEAGLEPLSFSVLVVYELK